MTSEEASPPAPPRRRLGLGAAVVAVLVVLAATVGIGVLRGASTPVEAVTVPTTGAHEASATAELYVHVAGAVARPGIYVLPGDARVVDAIAAAGGFAVDAARDAVNLARPLSDGEQLHVPVPGGDPVGAAAAETDTRVDLNTADAAALDTLPRIGPALAQRIIEWRDDNGRFTSVEDLLAVPGIGDKMLEALRGLVRI